MHSSWFSYNLTRPYPVRWFTPVTIVGGILITILISFLSVGTSGYQLIAVSTADPNGTEASRILSSKSVGSLVGSLEPKCDSATLLANSFLYTNNSQLPYSIQKVVRLADGQYVNQASLIYHNNPLHSCIVNNIVLQFESAERSGAEIAISQQGMQAAANITCLVDTAQGVLGVILKTTYDSPGSSFGPNTNPFYAFPGRNRTSLPSLFYAESLLAMSWINLVDNFAIANQALETPMYKGVMSINREGPPPTSIETVKSLDMFVASCFFVPFSPTSSTNRVDWCNGSHPIGKLANASSDNTPFPRAWPSADTFAKALYYTIMADLGQHDPRYPNIFADSSLLAHFTQNFNAIKANASSPDRPFGLNVAPDCTLFCWPLDSTWPNATDLHIGPSVLATDYLCQIPRLKPTGSLIVAVLIADLVLLRTIWQVYKTIVDWILQSKHPELSYCAGCMSLMPPLEGDVEVSETSSLAAKQQDGYALVDAGVEVVPAHDQNARR